VRGKPAEAEQTMRAALAVSRRNRDLLFATQSERQQFALAENWKGGLHFYLYLAQRAGTPAETVYDQVLAWKGVVSAQQHWRRQQRRAAQQVSPEATALYAKLQSVSGRLAALHFAAADAGDRKAWQEKMQELVGQKEDLERQLAKAGEAFRDGQGTVAPRTAQLQAALPRAVLVDVLEYAAPKAGCKNRVYADDELHLGAFVIRRGRPIVWVALGPEKPIEQAVEGWRAALGVNAGGVGRASEATELRRLVWEPLQKHVEGARALLVSPDGALARLPVGALPGSMPGTDLLEELPVAVVPVPRLLVSATRVSAGEPKTGGSLLLVGDVDFDAAAGANNETVSDSATRRRAIRREGLQFRQLPGTTDEISAIKRLFQTSYPDVLVQELRRADATSAAFRAKASQCRYLHLATHGFFAPAEVQSLHNKPGLNYDPGRYLARSETAGCPPALLSGLALAGANHHATSVDDILRAGDDGIVTALEVSELDLHDTDLVVLSACETGLGRVAGGEGALGLQRAFQTAGAQTVVTSLWSVDDNTTRQLMSAFYHNLWDKKLPKLEALRQAQLALLRRGGSDSGLRGIDLVSEPQLKDSRPASASPRLWAAWVLSGDPGELPVEPAVVATAGPATEPTAAEPTAAAPYGPGNFLDIRGPPPLNQRQTLFRTSTPCGGLAP
jgi:CHAT domain-containing protein